MVTPNLTVGINVTWRCNISCLHCFYRFDPKFNKEGHRPLEEIKQEIDKAPTQITLIGQGEPMLHPNINDIIAYATANGLKSCVITNGTFKPEQYQALFDRGLDHLQLSTEGFGLISDKIAGHLNTGKRQERTLQYLKDNNLKFRVNITLQKGNYEKLKDISRYLLNFKPFHIAYLNFLPHYKWNIPELCKQIAVHPKDLATELNKCLYLLNEDYQGIYKTIRYFPMCYLPSFRWQFVTNAIGVVVDPLEWSYGDYGSDMGKAWSKAVSLADSVGIKEPCKECYLYLQCGGWNRYYRNALDVEITPLKEFVAPEYKDIVKKRWSFMELNPVNLVNNWNF